MKSNSADGSDVTKEKHLLQWQTHTYSQLRKAYNLMLSKEIECEIGKRQQQLHQFTIVDFDDMFEWGMYAERVCMMR